MPLRGYMGLEISKIPIFLFFYPIVQHIKNIFPKFHVNRTKTLGESAFGNPSIAMSMHEEKMNIAYS